jgi:hypothetical protein
VTPATKWLGAALLPLACSAPPPPADPPAPREALAAPPPKSEPVPASTCEKACIKLRGIMMAELDSEVQALPPEVRESVLARAAATRQSDIAHCSQLCENGRLDSACIDRAVTKVDLAACVRRRERAPHAQALKAALSRCELFRASIGHTDSDCAALGQDVQAIAEALRDVDGEVPLGTGEEAALRGCLELAADTGRQRCPDDADYDKALSLLMIATMQ